MAKRWLYRILVLLLIGGAAAPVLAQDCLDEARDTFASLRLSETIVLLEDCRSRGWPEMETNQKIAALRLLALAYIEEAEIDKARESVRLLMQEDRGYRAPETDPMIYQDWVEELRPKTWYQKRWVQLGAATVVGVVLGIVFTPAQGPADLPAPVIGPPSN